MWNSLPRWTGVNTSTKSPARHGDHSTSYNGTSINAPKYQTTGLYFHCKTNLRVLLHSVGSLLPEAHFSPRISGMQRKAARFVKGNYQRKASVTQMLQELNWDSLEDRRTVARLTMLYKINSDELPITIPEKFIPVTRNQRPVTRSQRPNQYVNFPARTEVYKNSFFPRTIRQWNQLPANIITDSTSAKSFNNRVWSYMQSDHSAQLYTGRPERRSTFTAN